MIAWRDLELTLVVSGPDKTEFRIPMTVGSIIEPGETLPYEKFFSGKVGADQLRSASSFSLEMSSASKKQNIPFQGFSGIWLQAEDCAQDHQSLMKLTGIALRERLLKFVSLGCGALTLPAEVKLTKLKSPPGFISVELDGKAGWIPLGSVKTFLRAEFRSTGLERLQ